MVAHQGTAVNMKPSRGSRVIAATAGFDWFQQALTNHSNLGNPQ